MNEERKARNARRRSRSSARRLVVFLVLVIAVVALAVVNFSLYLEVRAYPDNINTLEERVEDLERENEKLNKENEELEEKLKMLRSSTVISKGDRNTNKVAITIDDGGPAELVNRALDHLQEHDIQATLFPMGLMVESEPEAWQRAVHEGHELGNHTYSHPYLTNLSDEEVREELRGWQDVIDETLGYSYETLFFRPPYMDGFTSTQSPETQKRLQKMVSDKEMITVLWDVEPIHALRNRGMSSELVAEHVLEEAEGGSIVLLHFNKHDVAALPTILSGLRQRGLEPCSLSELLLAEPEDSDQSRVSEA